MSGCVPTTTTLSDIYTSDALEAEQQRWASFLSTFENTYSGPPEFVIRCPGRVNLIGEHIDYSLYDVLPMAVQQDVLVAVSSRTPQSDTPNSAKPDDMQIRLASTFEGFPTREFRIQKDGRTEIDNSRSDWANYFKAGVCGAAELLGKSDGKQLRTSLDVLVTGSVPPGAGMSSSSAFVCASALAVLTAAGRADIDKLELVETALVAERLAGVNSGGMDQAASVCSERGSATAVSFAPKLAVRPVKFPDTSSRPLNFLIAQSLVVADKHVTAPEQYNLRVVECSLAAAVLARITSVGRDLKPDKSPLGICLRTFADAFFERRGDVDGSDSKTGDTLRLEKMLKLVEDYLPQEEGYTREQISEILGMTVQDLESKYMTAFPVRAKFFKLRQRALHVFGEALRVKAFQTLLEDSAPESADDSSSLIKDLGAFMNTTQDSCRELYECSCPELDELCEIAQAAGAAGSRLTGAGWGGCSVHLVPEDRVDKVKQAWIDKYYRKRYPDITDDKLREAIVVSKPGSGSFVVQLDHGKVA